MRLTTALLSLALLLQACATTTSPRSEAPAVAVAFSPGHDDQTAEALVLVAIATAQHTIRVAAYSFTSKEIAQALVDAHKNGIDVQAVLDKSNRNGKYSGATFLTNHGIPVRISDRYAIMHNKFMVIDGTAVQTGSFNYTAAAAGRNAENVVWVKNSPGLAAQYLAEWQRLWDEAGK